MKKINLLFILFFSLTLVVNAQNQNKKQKTDAGKAIEWVADKGEKAWKIIEGLFPKKHKTPTSYIPVSPISLTTRDSFNNVQIQKGKNLELELKVLYPRITFEKGYISFQMGDYKYFRYLKDVKLEDIEHIKLKSINDTSNCIVKKFRILPKKEIKRHFSFILDHSGSMGGKRADQLQLAVFNAISKDYYKKKNNNTYYTIYKFDHQNQRLVTSNNLIDVQNSLIPTNRLKGFGGATAIKDAILSGIENLSLDNKSETKIMILFTDGITNYDKTLLSMSDVIKKALDKNINIVTVGFGSHIDKYYLDNISSNSGGNLYWIYNEREFEQLFDNVLTDVEISYDIEFSPCMFGDEIEIELKIKGIDSHVVGSTIFRSPVDEGYSIDMDILFANGSYYLNKDNFDELDQIVNLMEYKPNLNILVEGHTDRLGYEKENLELSIKRANSVKNYLVKKGISKNRIEIKGYGEDKPAYSYLDGTEINEFNRRIEIKIN
jgi:flagellar motor protein MotB